MVVQGQYKGAVFRKHSNCLLIFFDYISFGKPVHQVRIDQKTDGFRVQADYREIKEFDKENSLRVSPFELVLKGDDCCELRYRYDWHKRARPERYQYNGEGNRILLNELAFELCQDDYGRAICNGRFVDWDTGIWWYEMCITNVMILTRPNISLDCFLTNTPTHNYRQIAQLR